MQQAECPHAARRHCSRLKQLTILAGLASLIWFVGLLSFKTLYRRVVWAHEPDAARWDGKTGDWWDDANTDQRLVSTMLSDSVRSLTGKKTENNSTARQYSRNLGKAEGIELIALPSSRLAKGD